MRLLVVLFLLCVSFLGVFGGTYTQNENYTNIHVEIEGWCQNIPVTFKIWNQTDFDNKQAIEDDYCQENQTPEKNNCQVFNEIKGTYAIKKGPFETMDNLASGSFTDNFSVIINQTGDYYYEIFPDGKYNSAHTTPSEQNYLSIQKCAGSFGTVEVSQNSSPSSSPKTYSFNQSFGDFQLTILNASLNETLNLTKNPLSNATISLNFTLSFPENFSSLKQTLTIPFTRKENTTLEVYYNSQKLSSQEYNVDQSTLVLNSLKSGIYTVEEIPIVVEQKKEINQTNESLTQEVQSENSSQNETINLNSSIPTQAQNSNTLILGGIILVFLAVPLFYIILKHLKTSTPYHAHRVQMNSDGSIPQDEQAKEIEQKQQEQEKLHSYQSLLDHTKLYLSQYQHTYSDDQLYRALKEAKIPEDIIARAFEEIKQGV